MRHVGDVHPEPEVAVRQPFDGDRIVEVARVLAVDGDRLNAAEVGAPLDVAIGDGAAQPHRFGDRLGECVSGMPCLRMMISVSTPGASMSPSTSATRPMAPRVASASGQLDDHHLAWIRAALLAGGITRSISTRRSNGAT
jgi:hypothetical protein